MSRCTASLLPGSRPGVPAPGGVHPRRDQPGGSLRGCFRRGALRGWRPLALLTLLAGGCDLPGRPNPADRDVPPEKVLAFAQLYQRNCAGCHGIDGRLGPAPPLNDDLFRAIVPVEVLQDVLEKGRPTTEGRPEKIMPAFAQANGGTLTPQQLQVLVNGIKGIPYRIDQKTEGGTTTVEVVPDPKGIQPSWGVPPTPKDPPPYQLEEAVAQGASRGDVKKGVEIFAQTCAACHGTNGRGKPRGDQPVLKINDATLLALTSRQALRRYIITGRADLEMPDYTGKIGPTEYFAPLTSQDVNDLAALLDYWKQGGSVSGR